MAQKSYYYVGVMDNENGMMFVTKANYQDRTAEWDRNGKPLAMSQSAANDIAQGLLANWCPSCVIKTTYELENQCCWVQNEEQKNIDKLSSLVSDALIDVALKVAHKWTDNRLTASVNLNTGSIRVLDDNDNDVVKFVPSERDDDTEEITAYEIYPYSPMWQLFRDTQENRESFVEQLESKTGKKFAFANGKSDRTNANELAYKHFIEHLDVPENVYAFTCDNKLDRVNTNKPIEDDELDLTAGNGRGR